MLLLLFFVCLLVFDLWICGEGEGIFVLIPHKPRKIHCGSNQVRLQFYAEMLSLRNFLHTDPSLLLLSPIC